MRNSTPLVATKFVTLVSCHQTFNFTSDRTIHHPATGTSGGRRAIQPPPPTRPNSFTDWHFGTTDSRTGHCVTASTSRRARALPAHLASKYYVLRESVHLRGSERAHTWRTRSTRVAIAWGAASGRGPGGARIGDPRGSGQTERRTARRTADASEAGLACEDEAPGTIHRIAQNTSNGSMPFLSHVIT